MATTEPAVDRASVRVDLLGRGFSLEREHAPTFGGQG